MFSPAAKHSMRGFTLIELLIIIVVIGILAALIMIGYNGLQKRAQNTKVIHDVKQIERAIHVARQSTGQTLFQITGAATVQACSSLPAGTNLADKTVASGCWAAYTSALEKISTAGGADITKLVDPWGRPYMITEIEGVDPTKPCDKDILGRYTRPYKQEQGSIFAYVYASVANSLTTC